MQSLSASHSRNYEKKTETQKNNFEYDWLIDM